MSSSGEAGQAGDEQNIKSEIDELITHDRVVIFSKSLCPYCVDAKNVPRRNL
jgi:hypothetical protein